ncbi:hypothetical protein B4U80_15057, partial [Leptotrombidium deliense]
MGSGKQLTELEIGKIIAFRDQGLSYRKIADRIGRSKTVVEHVCKDPEGYGKRKSPGRPRKLDEDA